MVLQRFDPFRELRQMEDTMNRLWRGIGTPAAYQGSNEDWNVLLDVIEQKDGIVVKASLPGVVTDDIDVSIEDNVLTLKAERKAEAEGEGASYLVRERPVGSFYRALRLPDSVDTAKVQSYYDNGVLSIYLPKAEEKKKKQIQIKVGSGAKEIEAAKK